MNAELFFTNLPALLIAMPLFGAFLTPIFGRFLPKIRDAWVILISFATSVVAQLLAAQVYINGYVMYVFGAAPGTSAIPIDSGGIPLRILFNIDAFGAFMLVSTAIVSFAVILHLTISQQKRSSLSEFYALYLLLVAGIFGMVSTGDMFNFFVFLEINSISASALIAYHRNGALAAEGALKYLIVNTVGGLMILFAIGLLYSQYNSLNMAIISQNISLTTLNLLTLVLFIAGLATKAGIVPFHLTTPDAYSVAPSGVTTLMIVASQAGLYGMFRILFSVYGGVFTSVIVGWIVIILGVLSMFIGVTMAIPQKDIKRLLSYHAISQTGYMLLGVGVALAVLGDVTLIDSFGNMAMKGGLFHIINHAMYKGLLFLTVGAVIYRTGVWDLNKMGGLGHKMKWTMIFFLIGALAIAGIPPFNGFASKLMIYESTFAFNPIIAIIAMVVSILTLASFMKVFHSVFMGPELLEYASVREVPRRMLASMAILAMFVIAFGFVPDLVVDMLITPVAESLFNQGQYIHSILGGGL
ncbi:MAG: NADH:ubiquinone oxidoreductase [Methanocalculaceae archaeon]|jgi:multicomponent Na+:H+ antiporter subunit D|nr:NADH:ubiquinone oxidoreductase [Methanocalculaceae archaeon]